MFLGIKHSICIRPSWVVCQNNAHQMGMYIAHNEAINAFNSTLRSLRSPQDNS